MRTCPRSGFLVYEREMRREPDTGKLVLKGFGDPVDGSPERIDELIWDYKPQSQDLSSGTGTGEDAIFLDDDDEIDRIWGF